MFTFIRSLATSGPVYVRIRRDWLSIRDAKTGNSYEDIPELAISEYKGIRSIAAIGKDAKLEYAKNPKETEIVNGFKHPRLIVHDFIVAEKTISNFLKKVLKNTIIRPSPIMIMHVTEKLEGGITPIEIRVLRELASGVGARQVYVWGGRELTDSDIINGEYKKEGCLSCSEK